MSLTVNNNVKNDTQKYNLNDDKCAYECADECVDECTDECTDDEFDDEYLTKLDYLRKTIEVMSKINQLGVLKILHKHKNIILNENKYGIHINLTEIPKTIINKLHKYVQYVNTQEHELNNIEQQKEYYKNNFF